MKYDNKVVLETLRKCQLSESQLAPYPTLRVLIFLIGGIITASITGFHSLSVGWGIVMGVSWLVIGNLVFPRSVRMVLWFCIGIALTSLHIQAPWSTYKRLMIGDECYAEADVVVTDMMLTCDESLSWLDPRGRAEAKLVRLRLHRNAPWQYCHGKVLLYNKEHVFTYGQSLRVKGAFRRPFPGTIPHQFNQTKFLKLKGIEHCVSTIELRQTAAVGGWRLVPHSFLRVRSWVLKELLDGIEEEEDKAVLAAMMFGLKSGLDKVDKNRYRESGMVHLFAVSGLHVGIIFSLVICVLNVCHVPFRWRYGVAPLVLLLYVIVTGAESSAVRAWVMLSVWSVGKSFYLPGKALNSVSVAALLLLIASPLSLFHLGFQYSFILVTAILCGWNKINLFWNCCSMPLKLIPGRVQGAVRWKYKALQIVITTVGAMLIFWLAGLGLTAYYSHLVLPMSIVSNVFVGFIAWGIMGIGWAKILIGMLHIPIIPSIMSDLLQSLIDTLRFLAETVSSETWVHGIGRIPLVLVMIYYVVFFALIGTSSWKRVARRSAILAIVIVVAVSCSSRPGTLKVDIILPNSSSVPVICVRDGARVTLVNCGSRTFHYSLANWLRGEGIRQVNHLVLLKGTAEYCGGLDSLKEVVELPSVYQLSGRRLSRGRLGNGTRLRYVPCSGALIREADCTMNGLNSNYNLDLGCSRNRTLKIRLRSDGRGRAVLSVGNRSYELSHSRRDVLIDSFSEI